MSIGIDFTLKANTAQFTRALASISNDTEGLRKGIMKKFDGGDLSRGLVTAFGLSIEKIADKFAQLWTGMGEGAEQALQRIEEASNRSAAAVQKSLDMRRDSLQQIAALQKDIARSTNLMNDAKNGAKKESFGWFGMVGRGSAVDKLLGLSAKEDAERAVKLAEAERDIKEQSYELAVKTKTLSEVNLEQIVRNENLRADYVRDNREQVELEAKVLAGTILPNEKLRLQILELQGKQRDRDIQIENILSKFPAERTQKEKQTLLTLERQQQVGVKQIAIKQQLIDKTKDQAAEEKRILEELEAQRKASEKAALAKFAGNIRTEGRGDEALSDRELEKKVQAITEDLFRRSASKQGSSDSGYDPLGEIQQRELFRAQEEIRKREEVRRNIAAFGSDRAFDMFAGSESKFSQIAGTQTALDKISGSLEAIQRQGSPDFPNSIVDQLKRAMDANTALLARIGMWEKTGLPVINLNNPTQ